MTPEMWTIVGAGIALCGIGTGGFTLLWRYVAAAEHRSERRDAAVEMRADARNADLKADLKADLANLKADLKADLADLKADLKADLADLKADVRMLADRMERSHADLRQAIDTLIVSDQAKRLTILEETVLRTTRSPDDREAQH